jgi:hypothetical protein
VKKSVTLDADLVAEAQRYLGERRLSQLVNEGCGARCSSSGRVGRSPTTKQSTGAIPDEALADVDAQWPR